MVSISQQHPKFEPEMKPWQDNQRKWSKSDHTLEQLKEKIASW
jgi:hypothetical protein